MYMSSDKVTTENNAQNQLETDNATWKTELAEELQLVIDALNDQDPDYKTVAANLRNLHMEFYADKLENLEYHRAAKEDNPGDTTPANEAIARGEAEQATDQVDTTDDTGTIRPARDDTGMATTDTEEPVATK